MVFKSFLLVIWVQMRSVNASTKVQVHDAAYVVIYDGAVKVTLSDSGRDRSDIVNLRM